MRKPPAELEQVELRADAEARPADPAAVARPMSRYAIALYRVAGLLLIIAIWDLALRLDLVDRLFLPPPIEVWNSLRDLAQTGLLDHVRATLTSAFVGFFLGTAVGVIAGVMLGVLPRVNEILAPFITMMNSMPRIALAPLFVLWFGIGMKSHVALVFSLVVFIVLTNTIAGAQSVDKEYVVLARLLKASRLDIIRKVVLPSTVPWIIAAMRLSWAYALAGAVVGEMFLGQEGLGYLITAGSGVFNIAQIFAALAITVVIAWFVDNGIRLAERKILRWRPAVSETA
jgi:NitT/TauT family transport system permease protein